MAAQSPDLDLVLVSGAGASYSLGQSGAKVADMKEWSDRLTGALRMEPGPSLLVGLHYGMEGLEFEQQLGRFLAAARAFRDSRELVLASSNLNYGSPMLQNLATRPNLEAWFGQVDVSIDRVFAVIHETLYTLFGDPSFDLMRAQAAYEQLLSLLGIARGAGNWVYATTNYDKIGDEALERAGFRVAWGERPRVRGGDRLLDPERLLDGVAGTVPVLHLHGRIGWFRRTESEGGEAYAADVAAYQPGFGAPIVMLPDPNKAYDSDPIINTIWTQFEDALSRAKRVLVLGHSLHDGQIVEAIRTRVPAANVAISVFGNASVPSKPARDDDPIIAIRDEHFPEATLLPIRFGVEGALVVPKIIEDWLAKDVRP